MTWYIVLGWLRKNYGAVAIGVLVLAFVGYCRARDAANVELGRREVLLKVRDSTVKSLQRESLELQDTVAALDDRLVAEHEGYQQQLAILGQQLGRIDTVAIERWLRDTVRVAGDTTKIAVPAGAILAADSALKVCSEVQTDCARFRSTALRRFATDSQTILLLGKPVVTVPSHRCGIQGTVGLAALYASGVKVGPGVTVGVGCRW